MITVNMTHNRPRNIYSQETSPKMLSIQYTRQNQYQQYITFVYEDVSNKLQFDIAPHLKNM